MIIELYITFNIYNIFNKYYISLYCRVHWLLLVLQYTTEGTGLENDAAVLISEWEELTWEE